MFLIIFLIGFSLSLNAYLYYKDNLELRENFSPLILILWGFTGTSFINFFDLVLYLFSNKTVVLIFLIPFLPTIFVLYGSKKIISQIVHRSKKKSATFTYLKLFMNITLTVFIVVVFLMIYGFFINTGSKFPVIGAIIGFFINQILFITIILLLNKQKSELYSSFNKVRIFDIQIGYIGLLIYFTSIVLIFSTSDQVLNSFFINLKAISSIVIIFSYYWSIIIPKWQEKKIFTI
jgi:hypothetical protein